MLMMLGWILRLCSLLNFSVFPPLPLTKVEVKWQKEDHVVAKKCSNVALCYVVGYLDNV